MRSTLSLTCVLLATACAGGSAPPAGLSAEDVAAIKRVQEKYNQTLLAGDWAGVAAVHTPDAVRMPPNAPDVRGRAAIEAAMATSGKPVAITTTITEIDGRGDAFDGKRCEQHNSDQTSGFVHDQFSLHHLGATDRMPFPRW